MAVIFGRTATTTLNRGVQLVVTPDFKVEPPPAPPWTLSFNDVSSTSGFGQTNTQTIPENVTLFVDFSIVMNFGECEIYKNSTLLTATNDDITLILNTNDTLRFDFYSSGYTGAVITLKETNSSGRVIDAFNVNVYE